MKRVIFATAIAVILFTAGAGNYQTQAQQDDGVQSVYFVQERSGVTGSGISTASIARCPEGGFIIFNFRAFKSAVDDSVKGSWAALVFEVFRSDKGALTELSVDENGFEAKGSMEGGFITGTTLGDEIATGETTIMCEGTPIDEDTMVTISGECGQDVDVSFETSNGITGTFGGDTICTTGDTSPINVTITSSEFASNAALPLTGMWVTVRAEDGTLVASGFTPITFNAKSSTVYRVTAADYAGLEHSSWDTDQPRQPLWDGDPGSNTRTVIPTSGMIMDAFYVPKVYLVKGFTELTNTANEVAPDLTVRAVLPDDDQPLHMWAIIQLVDGASSPQLYRVHMHNYQDIVFDHWEDGSTDMVRDIMIEEDTTITAYYRTR